MSPTTVETKMEVVDHIRRCHAIVDATFLTRSDLKYVNFSVHIFSKVCTVCRYCHCVSLLSTWTVSTVHD